LPYPFDDEDGGIATAEDNDEQQRKFMNLRFGLPRKSVLGNRGAGQDVSQGDESPDGEDGSRGSVLGAASRPRIPDPRTVPNEQPTFGNLPPSPKMGNLPPMGTPSLLGRSGTQPTRPDVRPVRSDFESKPEVGGWKKVLGLGLATLAGSPQITEQVLHGQRDKADRLYGQASKDWQGEQADKEQQARLEETQARTNALRNPKPDKPENLDREAYDYYVSKGMSPADARKQVLADAADQKPDKTQKPTFEEQNYAEWADTQKKTGKPSDRMTFERQLHPKDTSGRDEARGDRSYQFHTGLINKMREPVESRMERVSRLEDTLNQGTPQADALVAPELLSVMAGGQGSGLRMNEAEIARIVGGRTNWETLKAKLGAWQTDPNKGFALTPDQREQTRQLFSAVKDRVSKKMAAIDEESENLSGTDSAAEHRRIYNRLQQRLSKIDAGSGQGQVTVTDPNGGVHTFSDQASADRFKKLAKIQ
jgi:hypothetical protein